MDWNALLIALIIFPILWGFSAAVHTRSYFLIGLSVVFLATSLGGCAIFMKREFLNFGHAVFPWGRDLFLLGYVACVTVSVVAIVRERRRRKQSLGKKGQQNAEQSAAPLPPAPRTGPSEGAR